MARRRLKVKPKIFSLDGADGFSGEIHSGTVFFGGVKRDLNESNESAISSDAQKMQQIGSDETSWPGGTEHPEFVDTALDVFQVSK